MYEFWYDYVKRKYGKKKSKLCYLNTDSFIIYIKTEYIYPDIAKDVKNIFDTSSNELDKSIPKWKTNKVIGLMENEIVGKIMKKFAALRKRNI